MTKKAEDHIPILKQGGVIITDDIDDDAVTSAKIADGTISGANLSTGTGYFTVATDTNGTSAVNVFGSGGAPVALTITGVYVVALDTTAGNITVQQAANTVCTVAKGTSAAALVGATTLSNATYAAGDVCTVLSSSAGNARVFITFTVA